MAAVTAVLFCVLRAGDVLVACGDGYPGIRGLADEQLAPFGVEVRLVPTAPRRSRDAVDGRALVWLETPSNPRLDLVDIAAAADAAHAAGALLAVDNTVCTPLGQRPLTSAPTSRCLRHQGLTGHCDLLLGAVSVARPGSRGRAARWRTHSGAIPGPVRSLARAPLAGHARPAAGPLERERAAVAALLRERDDVEEVAHPSGELASARWRSRAARGVLPGERRARPALPRACELVARRRASAACTRPPSAAGAGARTPSPRVYPLLRGLRGRGGPVADVRGARPSA